MNIIVPKILLIGIVILILVSAPVMALTREEVLSQLKPPQNPVPDDLTCLQYSREEILRPLLPGEEPDEPPGEIVIYAYRMNYVPMDYLNFILMTHGIRGRPGIIADTGTVYYGIV